MIKYFIPIILINFIFGQNLENSNTSPMHILGTITKTDRLVQNDLVFDTAWVKELKLLLPCENTKVPKRSTRLPNALREYRNGIHRGIDFFANWGTDVRAVAKGFVVRADHNYIEYPAGFREKMLKSADKVGHTPSDIFNNVLLGKAVFIDHGFDLVPGFRSITIYAHLSSIEKNISVGTFVNAGQIIGKTGNSGTKPSTLGKKNDAHLHWEMILQNNNKEIFLGKDIPYEVLYNMLSRIFQKDLPTNS